MNRPYLLALIILALTTAGSLTFGVQQYRRAEQLARAAAAADSDADRHRASTAATNDTDRLATQSTADVARAAEDDAVAITSIEMGADRNGAAEPRRGSPVRLHELMEDPAFAAAWQAQQKAGLDGRYADLFRKLRLSPQQVDQLKTLLAERMTASMDVMSAAREQGFGGRENRDELRQLMQATQAEIDAGIRELLGDQGFTQLQHYERSAPQRTLVNQLESRLSYSSAPLTSAQSEALVNILSETSGAGAGRTNRGGVSFGPGASGPASRINDAALVRAQAVLSADQLNALRQMQSDQQAAQEVRERMREQARRNRPSPPEASPPRG